MVVPKLSVALSSVLLLACASAQRPASETEEITAERLELSEAFPPKVYQSQEGTRLTIVILKGDEEALVQFTGYRHALAGKVLRARLRLQNSVDVRWVIDYDGEEYTIASTTSVSNRGLELVTRLHLPMSKSMKLPYSEELTHQLNLGAYFDLREKHERDGSIALLEEFDRSVYLTKKKKGVGNVTRRFHKYCGSEIPVEFDWDSFDKEDIVRSNPCETSLGFLSKVCRRDFRSAETVKAITKKVKCTVGERTQYNWDGKGTLDLVASRHYFTEQKDKKVQLALLEQLGLGRTVLKNDAGDVLVFNPDSIEMNGLPVENSTISFGNGKIMHALRKIHGRSWATWGPMGGAEIKKKDGQWVVVCLQKETSYRELPREEAKKILDTATFEGGLWKREPLALSRDQRGIYYYVDRLLPEFGGKGFRVFKGPRGQLKQTNLVDIIDDQKGKIFSTKQGELRLLLGEGATWIEGRHRDELTIVWEEKETRANLPLKTAKLIYHGLGVYDGQVFGTLCD